MSRKPPPSEASASQSRNEYIPSFISQKPFYVDAATTDADYLEHQRLQSAPQDTLDKAIWYNRGNNAGPAATKFRKGACTNCGAMGHQAKDCVHRPRKAGAKFTGKNIQADEVLEDVNLGWDAKRDRWNGYDSREYSATVKEKEEFEALQSAAMGESTQKQHEDGEEGATPGNAEFEEAKYAEETDMGRNQPTSTRNLRLREDTAKYLLNLDPESAKYDPKTRSMAEMGDLSAKGDNASALIAEDNFMRASGDAAEFERAQKYAWETQEKGSGKKLHLQANPTEGEFWHNKLQGELEAVRAGQSQQLHERYEADQHLKPAPVELLLENERYVEYDASGAVKGQITSIPSSRYAEDVRMNNHTEIFGSWFDKVTTVWGYKCCYSLIPNSYCTGEAGKRAAKTMRIDSLLLKDPKNVKEGLGYEDLQSLQTDDERAQNMEIDPLPPGDVENTEKALEHGIPQQPRLNDKAADWVVNRLLPEIPATDTKTGLGFGALTQPCPIEKPAKPAEHDVWGRRVLTGSPESAMPEDAWGRRRLSGPRESAVPESTRGGRRLSGPPERAIRQLGYEGRQQPRHAANPAEDMWAIPPLPESARKRQKGLQQPRASATQALDISGNPTMPGPPESAKKESLRKGQQKTQPTAMPAEDIWGNPILPGPPPSAKKEYKRLNMPMPENDVWGNPIRTTYPDIRQSRPGQQGLQPSQTNWNATKEPPVRRKRTFRTLSDDEDERDEELRRLLASNANRRRTGVLEGSGR